MLRSWVLPRYSDQIKKNFIPTHERESLFPYSSMKRETYSFSWKWMVKSSFSSQRKDTGQCCPNWLFMASMTVRCAILCPQCVTFRPMCPTALKGAKNGKKQQKNRWNLKFFRSRFQPADFQVSPFFSGSSVRQMGPNTTRWCKIRHHPFTVEIDSH